MCQYLCNISIDSDITDLDNLADGHLEEALAIGGRPRWTCLRDPRRPSRRATGHACLDLDTTPQDNGKTKKEGVSRTYMPDLFGFAPIFVGFMVCRIQKQ
jgi:hypothetical protein